MSLTASKIFVSIFGAQGGALGFYMLGKGSATERPCWPPCLQPFDEDWHCLLGSKCLITLNEAGSQVGPDFHQKKGSGQARVDKRAAGCSDLTGEPSAPGKPSAQGSLGTSEESARQALMVCVYTEKA